MADVMNEGSLDPDEKSEEKSKNGPGQSGVRWIMIIVVIALMLYGASHLLSLKFGEQRAIANRGGAEGNQPTATTPITTEDKIRQAAPDPRYGVFTVSSTKLTEFDVPPGWSYRVIPVATVKIELSHYVDDILQDKPLFNESRGYRAGILIKPGQQVQENPVAYVLYVGPEPRFDIWYPAALAAGGIRQP